MPSAEYAQTTDVVAIRLYEEESVGSGGNWAIDGIDSEGRHTESCWSFDTEEDAVAAIPEFCANHGIDPSLPVKPGHTPAPIDRSGPEEA